MKRILIFSCIVLTIALLAFNMRFVNPARADFDDNVKVLVNNKEVNFPDQGPFIDSQVGRTYVPLRFVSEALGGVVEWNQYTQTASVNKSGTAILMKIGSKIPTVNGQVKVIDAVALLVNDRTVVPLRFVSECLGATVEWDVVNRVVRISTSQAGNVPPGYRVTSVGYVVPEKTKLEIEDKEGDVNLQILVIIPYGDLEMQFGQAEDILASVHGRNVAKAAVDHARKKTTVIPSLEYKQFEGKISVLSGYNTPYITIQVWR